MRAKESKGAGFWLLVLGAVGVGIYAATKTSPGQKVVSKVAGGLQTVADALNPFMLKRYLALRDLIRSAASEAGIPSEVLAGTIRVESSYSNTGPIASECKAAGINCTCSRVLAVGLAQIRLAAAHQMGYTGDVQGLCDPATNLKYSAKYLKWLAGLLEDPASRHDGDDLWTAVRKAYNAGIGNYKAGKIYTGTNIYASRAEATQNDILRKGLAGLYLCRAA